MDINHIKLNARLKQAENQSFEKFLKSQPNSIVDQQVLKLNKSISQLIDCTQCANCCKILQPAVTDSELDVLATEKHLSAGFFKKAFLFTHEIEGVNFFKQTPCIFLVENKCSCYTMRPASCADYPHLAKPNFKYRLKSIMENYKLCPIVYNVVEQLKIALQFKY